MKGRVYLLVDQQTDDVLDEYDSFQLIYNRWVKLRSRVATLFLSWHFCGCMYRCIKRGKTGNGWRCLYRCTMHEKKAAPGAVAPGAMATNNESTKQ